MNDIVEAVNGTQDRYNAKRSSKAWKWLTQLSSRINHYGSILDVMVQHHPEYAALVWGAMKVLFVVRAYPQIRSVVFKSSYIGSSKPRGVCSLPFEGLVPIRGLFA